MKAPVPFLLLALAVIASHGCARAEAQTMQAGPRDGQGNVELVVYAGDFAMVRDVRRVDLSAGRVRLGLQGVSKSLDQDSVVFSWPKTKDARVVSSTYDLGMNDSGHLLRRFLGKEVELVYRSDSGREGDRTRGILEVADPGNVVVRADGKYIVNPNATIEAPADAGIVTLPQLSADVESGGGGSTDLAVTYMTSGMGWSADYTATLAPEGDQLGLECWATVTNKTGTDFPDAKLRFVAGSPNQAVRDRSPSQVFSPNEVSGSAAAKSDFRTMNRAFDAPQAMGELVAYPYKASATIRQDQSNRVRMMGSDAVKVKRVYSVALPTLERDENTFNQPDARQNATLGINFANAKDSGLGLPLPGGTVRVYEPDAGGAIRYVGAATLGDTPKNAAVSLELSKVFDVYARARQVAAQRVDKKHTRRTIEVVFSNEKPKGVDVRLVQPIDGGWKIADGAAKGVKTNAQTSQWTVHVPAGGEARLRYTVLLGP